MYNKRLVGLVDTVEMPCRVSTADRLRRTRGCVSRALTLRLFGLPGRDACWPIVNLTKTTKLPN
jgi:hypothetical protein